MSLLWIQGVSVNGASRSELICPHHLRMELLLPGPGLHYPVLLEVEAAVGQDLLGSPDHRHQLLAVPDNHSGVKTIRYLRGSGASGEISLTFAKDDLAEKKPCAVHQTHPGQLGEVNTAAKKHELSPFSGEVFQRKVVFNNFVQSLIGGAVKKH